MRSVRRLCKQDSEPGLGSTKNQDYGDLYTNFMSDCIFDQGQGELPLQEKQEQIVQVCPRDHEKQKMRFK